MIEIPLTQGKVALIDDEDFELVSQYKWYAHKQPYTFYAATMSPRPNRKLIKMHRIICGVFETNIQIDHIDHNGLNNQRSNLRICTKSENMRNRAAQINNTSGYKGISWHKATKKWIANIKIQRKQIFLGLFEDPEEAYMAYCKAAQELHGEFAHISVRI